MKQYHDLLESILHNGESKEPARENMPCTTSLFGYQTSFDLTKGFPLLTTKKMPFKSITAELLWFLKGGTNIKWLKENGCNVWDDDAYRYFQELFPESKATKEEFLERVKAGYIRKGTSYTYGDLGAVYGFNWRMFNSRLVRKPQPQPKLDPALKATKLGVANGDFSRGSRLKNTWDGMIDRCYNKNSHSYRNYGGRGVYVCDRWLVFRNFEQDAKLLPGWGNKELMWDRYELDKDIKGDGFVYSKESCIWASLSDNNCGYQNEYTIKKEDKEYTFSNISEFARANNLDIGNLSRLVAGNRKSHKGFVLVSVKDKHSGVDQVLDLIMGIRQNPTGRRHIISAWNPSELDSCGLPPCHMFVQFNCRKLTRDQRLAWLEQNFSQSYVDVAKSDFEDVILDIEGAPKFYLDASMYMRSADAFLGVPFNIASYALLTHIVALLTGMTPGKLVMSFGDLHIYDNHRDAVGFQLSRDCNEYQLPTVALGKVYNRSLEAFGKLPEYLTPNEVNSFIEQIQVQDFVLNDYNSYPAIKAELSVGLDKAQK